MTIPQSSSVHTTTQALLDLAEEEAKTVGLSLDAMLFASSEVEIRAEMLADLCERSARCCSRCGGTVITAHPMHPNEREQLVASMTLFLHASTELTNVGDFPLSELLEAPLRDRIVTLLEKEGQTPLPQLNQVIDAVHDLSELEIYLDDVADAGIGYCATCRCDEDS